MSNASIGGIISGFNTEDIISQMSDLQRAPQIRLNGRKTTLQNRKDAWEGVKTKVLALQKSAVALASPSLFKQYSAASSDASLLTVTASNEAAPGNYAVTVLQTAQAQQLKSTGFADTNGARLGTGSITLQSGAHSPVTITIDSTNNTLAGLRDAINRAGVGVTASIVNDGDASAPYRLVLSANETGAANAITVNANLSGGEALSFSILQDARDAQVSLGDAAGGITVTKSSNTITDLIEGVTLNLLGADSDKKINISVTRDASAVKSAVRSFADAYNALQGYVAEQTKYDSESKTGGPLIGDYSLQMLNDDIRDLIVNPVSGLPSGMSLLSQVGITIDGDNTLSVNDAELNKALSDDPEGVCKLFAELGEPSDSTVRYISSNSKTKASDSVGYPVNITRIATRARVTAGVAQTSPLACSEILTLNGIDITLSAGMTQADVIAAINAKTGSTGICARASGADGSGSGNYLTLERVQYGSSYTIKAKENVSNAGGNATGIGAVLVTETNAAGENGLGSGAVGQDVAGTINGEAANGSGQILSGVSGNANTEGLILQITSTTTGDHGRVVVSRGVGSSLNTLIDRLANDANSIITGAEDTLQKQIDDINTEITRAQQQLEKFQERLRAQFDAMESALSTLKNQSSQLSMQIASLSGTSTTSS